ncbi:hypothetical protein BCR33DRAFT_767645 [Rhizoclosmatium globosum]|uniref:Uncharacterized protein n=1 Tax=Rhizoclosmatium globosum TaxID=329046 RepID=A0A1Y2C2X8_9FUNG|nr:hypothetical protein BCR33DRAFT_767645 [Rhizoclosmatium globosum]|eukprot:ORY41361.1 hypothetical protein BCR33DRAFT_767645 [Rhizoclosmatium globosum]
MESKRDADDVWLQSVENEPVQHKPNNTSTNRKRKYLLVAALVMIPVFTAAMILATKNSWQHGSTNTTTPFGLFNAAFVETASDSIPPVLGCSDGGLLFCYASLIIKHGTGGNVDGLCVPSATAGEPHNENTDSVSPSNTPKEQSLFDIVSKIGTFISLTEIQINGIPNSNEGPISSVEASSDIVGRGTAILYNGRIDGNWAGGDVSHTNEGPNEKLTVRGTIPVDSISQVIIYGRTDCCFQRMNGLAIIIGTQYYPFVLVDNQLQKYVATVFTTPQFRLFDIVSTLNTFISLTEIEVNGIPNSSNGPISLVETSSEILGHSTSVLFNGKIDGNMNNGDVTHTNDGPKEKLTVYGPISKYVATVSTTQQSRLFDIVSTWNTFISLTEIQVNSISNSIDGPISFVEPTSEILGHGPGVLYNGKIDGNMIGGDVTHTNDGPNEKLSVYGTIPVNNISQVVIYGRTDCCWERMNGLAAVVNSQYYPFLLLDAQSQKYVSTVSYSPELRYFDIVSVKSEFISLTEIQINGIQNQVAISGPILSVDATSDIVGRGTAILYNGKIDGNWAGGDVTHTNNGPNEKLTVNIAIPVSSITEIVIYGRTDCCIERMAGLAAHVGGRMYQFTLVDSNTQKYAATIPLLE